LAFVEIIKKNFDPRKEGDAFVQMIQKRTMLDKEKFPTYPGVVEDSHFGDYYYPSLWGYYNLLPVQLRNHPLVIAAFQGLEKHHYGVGIYT
jgi:hypothetical protein